MTYVIQCDRCKSLGDSQVFNRGMLEISMARNSFQEVLGLKENWHLCRDCWLKFIKNEK